MKFKDVEPYSPKPRVSCGISVLDKLLGYNRSNGPFDRPEPYGLHFPSSILLTGKSGVGKTELLLRMRGLWAMPVLYFGGGMRVTNKAIRAAVSIWAANENHALILDDVGLDAKDAVDVHFNDGQKVAWKASRDFGRILIVVQAVGSARFPIPSNYFSTHLHMKKCEFRTVLTCMKNRFGPCGDEIYRLDGSRRWKAVQDETKDEV